MPLEDIIVDTFEALVPEANGKPIAIRVGNTTRAFSREDVEDLRNAILNSLSHNELKVEYSSNDQQCPLRDNFGTCVTFLTNTSTQQVSVDMGRIARHDLDVTYVQRAMIHEAFRLKGWDDLNDQYSRRLSQAASSSGMASLTSAAFSKILAGYSVSAPTAKENATEQPCPQASTHGPLEKNLGDIERVVRKSIVPESKRMFVCGVWITATDAEEETLADFTASKKFMKESGELSGYIECDDSEWTYQIFNFKGYNSYVEKAHRRKH